MNKNKLTLLEYGFGTAGHSVLMERIARSVESGQRVYLIVPEQQTVVAEAEFSEYLPPSSALNFEVTNFTRFADTVFRALGGLAGDYTGGGRQSLLMWRTLTEVAPMLNMTRGGSQITPGILARATSALNEARGAGLTPEEISRLEGEVGDGRLRGKLSDLAIIYSAYARHREGGSCDAAEAVASAAERLGECPELLRGARVYLDGFTSFTVPQIRFISSILSACSVTLTLQIPEGGGSFEFKEIRDTRGGLLRLAERLGIDTERVRVTEPDNGRIPLISEAASLLFKTDGRLDGALLDDTEAIRVFRAATPFEECDFIAADIKRRVMEGEKYSDFAIICRGAEDYAGILDTALNRVRIPHFVSRRRTVDTADGIKLVRLALRMAAFGLRAEWVIGYAKCPVSGISAEECDILEEYMSRWQIDGRALYDPNPWKRSPRGYDGGDDGGQLDTINEIKERLLAPLRRLSAEMRAGGCVRDMATALVNFLTEINLDLALSARAAELRTVGYHELADMCRGLWRMISDALDTVVEVMGDTPTDPESFLNIFAVAISDASVSRIPAHVDEVTVGQADVIRMRPRAHVYLLGVNEGAFPATVKDDSYFTENDKLRLMAHGADLSPELEIKSARELFSFLRAFTFAERSVTLSYTDRSASFAPTSPSTVISRLSEISGGKITPTQISSLPIERRVYSPDAALLSLGGSPADDALMTAVLTDAGREAELKLATGDIANDCLVLGPDATGILYKGDLYLSQSRIDSYLRCPMLYFCRYNLGLSEGGKFELDNRIIGTFIHGVLENFFIALKEAGLKAGSISEEDKRRIASKAADDYVAEMIGEGDARQKITVARLCRAAMPIIDGLCREFGGSKFEPQFFELKINDREPDAPKTVKISAEDGTRIIISGIIDRLDTYKCGEDVYVRVVDYKTGTKEFDPRDLPEGKNLQMLLYLKSVSETDTPEFRARLGVGEGGRIIPAGVIYVKTRVDDTVTESPEAEAKRVGEKLAQREGMVLLDDESLAAQNPEFLPIKTGKGGELTAASQRRTYTAEGWSELDRTVCDAVRRITAEIKSGNISVRESDLCAFKSPCESCSFKAVCRTKY